MSTTRSFTTRIVRIGVIRNSVWPRRTSCEIGVLQTSLV